MLVQSKHHQAFSQRRSRHGVAKLYPCCNVARIVRCCAWEYEEARWQPLHEVQQHFSETSSAVVDQGPSATLRRVLDVVRDGDLDGMLEFCPDEVIDRLLAFRKETG